jgi:colicin import membrane protein
MKTQKNANHFIFSLLMHVVILAALIFSYEWSSQTPVLENSDQKNDVVNATVMNNSKIEIPKVVPKAEPVPPKPKIIEKPKEIVTKEPEPPKKILTIPQPDKTQLLADLKKQMDKQKKIRQKKLEADFAKELKQTAAKSLEDQLKQEAQQISAAQMQKMQGIVDKYKALILSAISQNWIVPANANKNLTSELMIRVAPGGTVLDVVLVKTSGDPTLDRSARAAVFKASPLPVPSNSDEFEPFRQFILKVKPEIVS